MTQRRTTRIAAVGAAGLLALSLAAVAAPAASASYDSGSRYELKAHLDPLNNSGVTGTVRADVHGTRIDVKAKVRGTAPGLPHAQHIHYGEQAKHECPTFRDDANKDFRVNVAEGVPQYGPIAVSLTTRGDTSPAKSALALDRMPVGGEHGNYRYKRDDLRIFASETESAREIAHAIARGEGVVVVHGVDYNENGKYDLDGAGPSELDPSGATPAEATDPAACGVLRRQ